jgi:hypothetical protein
MGRSIGQASVVRQSRGIRRSMLLLLAFVYLFVGIAHNISCFNQAVVSSVAVQNAVDASDESGTQANVVLCDHCPTCVPAVMPTLALIAVPAAQTSGPVVTVARMSMAAHLCLDTPPPKHLI